ncbi:MAG: hypothetical protein IPN34_18170 [Planctomycetes bacterium]|nr:hypothetical protein [Planctomycetota bacterium]
MRDLSRQSLSARGVAWLALAAAVATCVAIAARGDRHDELPPARVLSSPSLAPGAPASPAMAQRTSAARALPAEVPPSGARATEETRGADAAAEPPIAARALGFGEDAQIELELVDAASGAAISVARVQRSGPGLELAAQELRGGRGTFSVRSRLPFDLAIEAAGYEVTHVRQTKLARGESSRVLRVALRPR